MQKKKLLVGGKYFFLQEAKKADKNKLLAEQIKMMQGQMAQMDKTVIQTRGGSGGFRGR